MYLSWRLLEADGGSAFHVYRQAGADSAATRLTTEPVRTSTDFVDVQAPQGSEVRYLVRPFDGQQEDAACAAVAPLIRQENRMSPSRCRATIASTKPPPEIWTATAAMS